MVRRAPLIIIRQFSCSVSALLLLLQLCDYCSASASASIKATRSRYVQASYCVDITIGKLASLAS